MGWYVSGTEKGCTGFAVVNDDSGEIVGCHKTRKDATAQLDSLVASEDSSDSNDNNNNDDMGQANKATYNTAERRRMAASGQALPDGSFPIANGADLKDAIRLVGQANSYSRARKHIISRARALGLISELPESWNVTKSIWSGTVFDSKNFLDK